MGAQDVCTEAIGQVTGAAVCLIEQAVVDSFIIGGARQVSCLFDLLCAVHWRTKNTTNSGVILRILILEYWISIPHWLA